MTRGIICSDLKQAALDFFFDEISTQVFEEKLYTSKDLEEKIGADEYLTLIGIDYKNANSVYEAKDLIRNNYDVNNAQTLFKHRVQYLADSMLNGNLDFKTGCIELWKMHNAGHDFIPIVFVGHGSELDDGQPLSFYEPRIRKDLKDLLNDL